jgi:2-hydroxy-6-oxonona-2,4-dienedioate hydrolase
MAVSVAAEVDHATGLAHTWVGPCGGRPTLVLHGGGPGCHALSDFAAVLAIGGHRRWLCVDLPGFGISRPLPQIGTWWRPEACATALAALLRTVGMRNLDILAQSLGGVVALALAASQPRLVGRIVLIGSQPTPAPGGARRLTRDPGVALRARQEYYGGEGPTETKMRRLVASLEWYDETRIPGATITARHRASLAAAACPGALPAPPDDIGYLLAEVASPTLVIWGRHDPFGGPDYAAALADALARGDLAVISRTAHHPQAERPELIGGLSNAFLGDGG